MSVKFGERKSVYEVEEGITLAPKFDQNGLIPVFIDAKIDNYNINERLLEKAISKKTKAIMIAHTLGNPFNVSAIKNFAKKHKLFLE